VGQNSGPVFLLFVIKAHRIKYPVQSIRSLQRHFLFTMSCCVPEIFALCELCEIAPKFDVFGRQNFGVGMRSPKFLTEFLKSGSLSTMWQSLTTIGDLGGEKEVLWPPASYAGRRPLLYRCSLDLFSPPNLRRRLADRHQTLPHRLW